MLSPLLTIAGPAQDFTWKRVGHLAAIDDGHAVDQHVLHPFAELIRIFKRCKVAHGFRIEYHEVCPHPRLDDSSVRQPHALRQQRGEFADGFFQAQFFLLTHVLAQNAGECPVGARMRVLAAEENGLDGLNIHCAIVGELHADRTRKVSDVLGTATGTRTSSIGPAGRHSSAPASSYMPMLAGVAPTSSREFLQPVEIRHVWVDLPGRMPFLQQLVDVLAQDRAGCVNRFVAA